MLFGLKAIAKETPMYFDAVSFKSDSVGKARLDCFAVIPYQGLKFVKSEGKYYAKYIAYLSVIDENEKLVSEKKFERTVMTENYFKAQGGAGDFDFISYSFDLNPTKYKVRIAIKDELGNEDAERIRNIALVNFDEHKFTLSGLLLVSKIEEQGSQFSITPFLSDNVSPIMNSFFVMFESYNNLGADTLKLVARIYDSKNEIKYQTDILSKFMPIGKSSNYFSMKIPKNFKQGNYTLRIYALNQTADSNNIDYSIIAGAERSIAINHGATGAVYDDINKAIEQCRYVATSEELDAMRAAISDEEKMQKFDEFWKKLDPTPGTDRNEAFDLYFARVHYANEKFKGSWGDGWKSDMGAVVIVYGNPAQSERSQPDYRGRVSEKWTYNSGKTFTFLDSNGFGEFRLYQPYMVSDKFVYEF